MNSRIRTLACTALALTTAACIARGPDDYRQVTRSLVDTEKSAIEGCFGGDSGKVVINFTVEKKTGAVTNAVVDEKASTADAAVGTCIAEKLDGLALREPDMRDGAATFTWSYSK